MHLSVKNGVKGNGAAHAKYIEREGKYADREDKIYSESGNMSSWAKDKPIEFWKAADKYERGASKGEDGLKGRSYKELEISLPRELTKEQQIELVQEFTKNVLGENHAYTFAIHEPKARDGETNPHVHLMFSERKIDGIERSAEQYFKRYNRDNPEKGGAGKDRAFTHKSFVHEIRKEWSATCNNKFQELGLDVRIDHRSYKEQEIDLVSQNQKRVYDNVDSVSVFEMSGDIRNAQRENGARIIENTRVALDALSAMQSTFSKQDLEKFLFTRTDGAEQFVEAYNAIVSSPEIQRLDDKSQTFTTTEMRQVEEKLIKDVGELSQAQDGRSIDKTILPDRYKTFNAEQKDAYDLMTGQDRICVVNGGAGTGKSYFLHSVNEAYTQAGHKVIGAALQGSTVQDMEHSTGIKSQTIASLVMRLEKEKNGEIDGRTLDNKTVLVIDEAGMVGSRDMGKLMEHVKESGASIRLVGDSYQLSAVSAGRALSSVQDALPQQQKKELVQVNRQRNDEHKQASVQLGKHDIKGGLSIYEKLGAIQAHETQDGARADVVAKWAANEGKSKVMLAYTNADTKAMNAKAREILRERGVIGADVKAELYKGANNVAKGDEIVFKKPSRELGVVNGMRGTIENITTHEDGKAKEIAIRSEQGELINVELDKYNAITHGYATTIHASQGMTVNDAYVLMSDSMNANLTYVALTRHRDNIDISYSKEQFKDTEALKSKLERGDNKTFSLDFDVVEKRNELQDIIYKRDTLNDKLEQRSEIGEFHGQNTEEKPIEKWASKVPKGTAMAHDPFSDDPLVEAQRRNPRNVQPLDAQARFKAEAEARRIEEERRREMQRQNQSGMRR